MAIVLNACGGLESKDKHDAPPINPNTGRRIVLAGKDGPEVLRYVHRPSLGYVRIERIEPGAPVNAHPFEISADALRPKLASIRLKGKNDTAFTNEELDAIVPHLAAALAKISPDEEMTFAVAGSHGLFGSYSSRTVTTGRVFVRDQKLNVVFGMIHDPYEIRLQTTDILQPLTPGTRAKRIDTDWDLTPGIGRLAAEKRPDWITFDVAQTAPAAAQGAGDGKVQSPNVDIRTEEIERRLRVLDRLKESGTITDEEYRERRRAILREL